jgi:DNA-binding transcriptional regulator YiaG
MTNLADMFDIAVNRYGMSGEDVWHNFANSKLAYEFEKGNPQIVAGKSGYELFFALYATTDKSVSYDDMVAPLSKSPEFWCGWLLAYYQWSQNTTFKAIQEKITFEKLLSLYPILHEVDEQKAADILYERLTPKSSPTKLSVLRKARELKQSELAALSGVTLRSIQMYEQRNKDINKAQAETLRALAKTLSCSFEDLIEN